MKVLITGGAGYIGTELVYVLQKKEDVEQIIVFDNLIRPNYNLFIGYDKINTKKVRFVKADLLDTRTLDRELKGIDIVYHLAAKVTTPFANHNPHEFDQINQWGTAELSYLLEKHSTPHVIYSSSTSVYGASDDLVNHKSDTNSTTFYGSSKLQGEAYLKQLPHTKVHILRLGNVFGYSKSMRFDSVINRFMFDANFNGRVKIIGTGEQRRSFVHIKCLTKFLESLPYSELPADVYNVVQMNKSVNEIVDELKRVYPNLEFLFVNQNAKMRSLNVEPDKRILNLLPNCGSSLFEDLQEFKTMFSF